MHVLFEEFILFLSSKLYKAITEKYYDNKRYISTTKRIW